MKSTSHGPEFKRPTLDFEDKRFMAEARGYCMTGDFNSIYPAIDRRINYGDEVRTSPMDMMTVLGSSNPRMHENTGGMENSEVRSHLYHHAELVQVIE